MYHFLLVSFAVAGFIPILLSDEEKDGNRNRCSVLDGDTLASHVCIMIGSAFTGLNAQSRYLGQIISVHPLFIVGRWTIAATAQLTTMAISRKVFDLKVLLSSGEMTLHNDAKSHLVPAGAMLDVY